MGRQKNTKKSEQDIIDELISENKHLKATISKMTIQSKKNDKAQSKAVCYDQVLAITKVKKKEFKDTELNDHWRCFTCNEGLMRIRRIYQVDKVYYIRLCNKEGCKNRTKKQEWNDDVMGIHEDT